MKSRRPTLVGLAVGLAVICAGPWSGLAQGPVEAVYATFLDPGNRNDPRAAAQTKMIEAFAKANPDIKGSRPGRFQPAGEPACAAQQGGNPGRLPGEQCQ